ncbi:hypothetical protein [Crocinitomix algicola]|uniref:hypothetical protein n=1 Tax=Crocinitomix algicola TaxID=1740263 RepID=UPI00083590AA|nr:hypothetical protein [Crocinitomix algicola]
MTKYTIFLTTLLFFSCSDGVLRGYEETSDDQKTYLVIEEDKGGGIISEVYVDNELWSYGVGEKGVIEPGQHSIGRSAEDCYIEFTVKSETVFHFDYWGP